MKITRWGFMSKKQLPLFMVWEEEWGIVNGELQVLECEMLTKHEAYQRCSINRVRLERRNDKWRVSLNEWKDDVAYYTNDLEDAVLKGASMRRSEGIKNAA